MIVKVLKENDKEEWEAIIQKLGNDSYYQYYYYKLYQDYGDGEMNCFVFEKGKNTVAYPFLKNRVSILEQSTTFYDIEGAYGYNGILSSTSEDDFIAEFYKEFTKYCKQENIIAEFTRFNPITNNYKLSQEYYNVILDRKTVCIEVEDKLYQSFYQSFSSSCKRAIKKAKKESMMMQVIEKPSSQDLLSFYNIYRENMLRVNASEYLMFNEQYFLSMQNIDDVIIFNACIENIVVGSFLCFINEKFAHYHLGASKTNYLKLRPNNFLYNEFIKFSVNKRVLKIHFGGGRTTSKDDSLLKFKLMFSKNTKDFFIGKKIHNKEIYEKAIEIWERDYPELKKTTNNLLRYKIKSL